MKVLITHEESQTVMQAFLDAGHDAYSCDLLPASGKATRTHEQLPNHNILPLFQFQ